MLSRSQRISVEQFNSVMEKGKIVHSSLFLARILGGQTDKRIAAVAPQKTIKKAVDRTKIRRKIYEAVKNLNSSISGGVHILILAKPTAAKSTSAEIAADLKTLFVKGGIMR